MTSWKPKENYTSFVNPVCPNCGTQYKQDLSEALYAVDDQIFVNCGGCQKEYHVTVEGFQIVLVNEMVKSG